MTLEGMRQVRGCEGVITPPRPFERLGAALFSGFALGGGLSQRGSVGKRSEGQRLYRLPTRNLSLLGDAGTLWLQEGLTAICICTQTGRRQLPQSVLP
jgi:hypothetical protein